MTTASAVSRLRICWLTAGWLNPVVCAASATEPEAARASNTSSPRRVTPFFNIADGPCPFSIFENYETCLVSTSVLSTWPLSCTADRQRFQSCASGPKTHHPARYQTGAPNGPIPDFQRKTRRDADPIRSTFGPPQPGCIHKFVGSPPAALTTYTRSLSARSRTHSA